MHTEPLTVTAFAKIIGVNRRQISRWRDPRTERQPAPDTLDLEHWRKWLKRTARFHQHAALEAWMASPGPAPGDVDTPPAPPSQPARSGLAPLPSTASDAERIARAKAESAELDVESKRAALQIQQGEMLPAKIVRQVSHAVGSLLAEELGAGIWSDLLPHLDGMSADGRAYFRKAHDLAFIRLRSRVAAEVKDRLADLLERYA